MYFNRGEAIFQSQKAEELYTLSYVVLALESMIIKVNYEISSAAKERH